MNYVMAFIDQNIRFYLEVVLKIVLAIILSGLIGLERESIHRPAGFRTHILVCVGSALVMITSEYMFKTYHSMTNLDPARLGAQVISGIGFLGAGTIIREGATVKGLTTAASLWAVSCIGIAIGIGFYSGAIISAIAIYLVLIALKKLILLPSGGKASKDRKKITFEIEMDKEDSSIGDIEKILKSEGAWIKNIKYIRDSGATSVVRINIVLADPEQYHPIIESIAKTIGVSRVTEH